MKLLVAAVATLAVVFAQTYRPVDPCQLCDYIINQALHHINRGFTEDQLQKELVSDCQSLQRAYGPDVVQNCIDGVNANIDTIYNDLKAGKHPQAVCYDLGQCSNPNDPTGTYPTHHPKFLRK
ncbi:unnamed protein product, partial [Mesorhabditis belari]|uniref:Saposin B-type domain-containing protein n=1 Tax=Mesorhabditis belari TaxID=2138241 RepID=A0AAF3EIL8_9BILA